MTQGMRHGQTLSSVDAAWFHIDKPTNTAVITGVMLFDEPFDLLRLKATLEARLLVYPRFTQRVRESAVPLRRPHWEDDPHFDLNGHLHRIALPAPGDDAALQALVGDLMGMSLDFSRPLWQLYIVENYGAGCAIVCRVHHSLADGLALVEVLLGLTDTAPDAPWPKPPAPSTARRSFVDALLKPVATALSAVTAVRHAARTTLHEGVEILTQRERARAAANAAVDGGRALAKLLLIPPDHRTVFKGSCGVLKRAVWSDPMALTDIKAIGQVLDGTINDVLLAALTGALRRYLIGRGESTQGVNIRVMVPVNLRQPGRLTQLGNRFGLIILSLPVGVEDPQKRTFILKQRMDAIKSTPEAVVAFGILSTIGMTPAQVEDLIVAIFAAKVSGVVTNVPGPRQQLYLAGNPLRTFMCWVPTPGSLSLGISILSYNGEVRLGIATDAGLVPDPETILAAFQEELGEMARWVRPDLAEGPPEADTPFHSMTSL